MKPGDSLDEAVKFINAAFDEQDGDIILRGSIDVGSLQRLLVDSYQREILPRKGSLIYWTEQLRRGFIPDIDLGMRGGGFAEKDGEVYLLDEVYIIDGLQRRTAALEIAKIGGAPRLGGIVRFNTTSAWERERFRILNMRRSRVSADILLRNQVPENEGLRMLFELTQDSSFPLYRRVCWGQRMRRDDLLHASMLLKTAARVHGWLGTGLTDSGFHNTALGFSRLVARVGRSTVRHNVHEFFRMIEDCWSVTAASSKKMAVCLRASFLDSIASLIADHENFWRDSELNIPLDVARKLGTLNVYHGYIMNLCASGSRSKQLYIELVEHLNKGLKTNRLIKRDDVDYDSSVAAGRNLRIVEGSPAISARPGGSE